MWFLFFMPYGEYASRPFHFFSCICNFLSTILTNIHYGSINIFIGEMMPHWKFKFHLFLVTFNCRIGGIINCVWIIGLIQLWRHDYINLKMVQVHTKTENQHYHINITQKQKIRISNLPYTQYINQHYRINIRYINITIWALHKLVTISTSNYDKLSDKLSYT